MQNTCFPRFVKIYNKISSLHVLSLIEKYEKEKHISEDLLQLTSGAHIHFLIRRLTQSRGHFGIKNIHKHGKHTFDLVAWIIFT